MADVYWRLVQIFSTLPKKTWLYGPCILLSGCVTLIVSSKASVDNLAFLKFTTKTKNCDITCNVNNFLSNAKSSAKSSLSSDCSTGYKSDKLITDVSDILGEYSSAGGRQISAEGVLVTIPSGCDEADNSGADNSDYTDLPKDWVGIVHYGRCYSGTSENSSEKWPSVIDRVKTALMFGASAIIILSMNPKLLKELDLPQMFSKPIILVQSPENITTVLSILSCYCRKAAVKVKITFNSTLEDLKKETTLTWWTSCGWSIGTVHGRQWAGVVCLDKHNTETNKADPYSFWNFFYSALLTLMLLFIVKAKRRNGAWVAGDQDMELSLRRLAHQALCVMTVKKYQRTEKRDMCAICLEYFLSNQKVRVLPCCHEFHTRCVDMWLVENRTCPLCKHNILGHTEKF
ncbi:RING finger protein 215-like isoform X2 [Liolophura sinensis]|uniref:RING finger protein 215-like isoform X2 n=1 Tax=Liolophura sinensis TaxID=3198878 RepID=UPI003158FCB3